MKSMSKLSGLYTLLRLWGMVCSMPFSWLPGAVGIPEVPGFQLHHSILCFSISSGACLSLSLKPIGIIQNYLFISVISERALDLKAGGIYWFYRLRIESLGGTQLSLSRAIPVYVFMHRLWHPDVSSDLSAAFVARAVFYDTGLGKRCHCDPILLMRWWRPRIY